MADDGFVASPIARPVRATVTELFDACEGGGLEETNLRMAVKRQLALTPPHGDDDAV